MLLQNDLCNVEITIDHTYTVNSADNKHYDFVYNPSAYKQSDLYYKVFSLRINFLDTEYRIALIGDFFIHDADCAVLEHDVLTVFQNNTIVQIRITDGSLIRCTELDSFGDNFGIYRIKNGYVIHGEIEITMLDLELNKKWTFSGKDIFASASGKDPFTICEHSVQLFDFEDNYYEIDFNGALLRQKIANQIHRG